MTETLNAEEVRSLRSEAESEQDHPNKRHATWQRLVLRLLATVDREAEATAAAEQRLRAKMLNLDLDTDRDVELIRLALDSPERCPNPECASNRPLVRYHGCRNAWHIAPLPASPRQGEPVAHQPGDNHDYRIECTVCGERGMIRLSVDPARAAVTAVDLNLSDEQAAILRDHLASRQQTASEFFGDVLMEYGLGRAIGKEWPPPNAALSEPAEAAQKEETP